MKKHQKTTKPKPKKPRKRGFFLVKNLHAPQKKVNNFVAEV